MTGAVRHPSVARPSECCAASSGPSASPFRGRAGSKRRVQRGDLGTCRNILRNVAQVLTFQERNANEIFLRSDLLRTHSGFIERLAIVRRVLISVANDALQTLVLAPRELLGSEVLLLVKPAIGLQRLKGQGARHGSRTGERISESLCLESYHRRRGKLSPRQPSSWFRRSRVNAGHAAR